MVPFVFTWVVSFQAKIMYFYGQNFCSDCLYGSLCIYLRSVILGKNNLFLATIFCSDCLYGSLCIYLGSVILGKNNVFLGTKSCWDCVHGSLCIYLGSVILEKDIFLGTKSFVGNTFMVPFVFTWVVSFQAKIMYFQGQNLVVIAFMVPFVFTWVVSFQAKIMYFYGQNFCSDCLYGSLCIYLRSVILGKNK